MVQLQLGYYTETNKLLLNVIGTITNHLQTQMYLKSWFHIWTFTFKRESWSQRAAGNVNTFAKNVFDLELKQKFTLVAEQTAYLDPFVKEQKEAVDFYNKTMQDNSVEEVEKMRKIALYSGKEPILM